MASDRRRIRGGIVAVVLLAGVAAVALSGCGYRLRTEANSRFSDANVRMDLSPFGNASTIPDVGSYVASRLREELRGGGYGGECDRLGADYLVEGKVMETREMVVSRSVESRFGPEYRLAVVLEIRVVEVAKGRVLYPVVAGAVDISLCSKPEDGYTATLLGNIDGDVLTLADNTQGDGTAEEFAQCYDPTWGVYKHKTHPTPGNHDYRTQDGLPYYEYFGSAAGEVGKGYYSYEIGSWHLIALNSQIDITSHSPQIQWLEADLIFHRNDCTLAYWHRPRFTSSIRQPSDPSLGEIWEMLYKYGVDIVLNGHAHLYERFAPQNPQGIADPNGIRQFVVGTGGGGSLDDILTDCQQ